jgi:hypothetical protein
MTKEEYSSIVFKSEDQFTAATHRYINNNYPELRNFYFHVPNESATSAAMRVKLHSLGVLSGVPDFCFIYPFLWFLELKHGNGKLSDKQRALHNLWLSHHIPIHTCYSAKEVVQVLTTLTKL